MVSLLFVECPPVCYKSYKVYFLRHHFAGLSILLGVPTRLHTSVRKRELLSELTFCTTVLLPAGSRENDASDGGAWHARSRVPTHCLARALLSWWCVVFSLSLIIVRRAVDVPHFI